MRIKVPTGAGVPRFIQVGNAAVFVPLEDLMAKHLEWLFPGMAVESCELFRITRNAMAEKSEEQADLLALIESELRDRKFALIVRLEVAKGMESTAPGHAGSGIGLGRGGRLRGRRIRSRGADGGTGFVPDRRA